MKTTLIYEPTVPAIKKVDLKITEWLEQLDHSLYNGPEYKVVICESSKNHLKPYRTIHFGGLNGYFDLNNKLCDFGLKNLIQESVVKNYAGIYVLKK